jgi:hypothetical protein
VLDITKEGIAFNVTFSFPFSTRQICVSTARLGNLHDLISLKSDIDRCYTYTNTFMDMCKQTCRLYTA